MKTKGRPPPQPLGVIGIQQNFSECTLFDWRSTPEKQSCMFPLSNRTHSTFSVYGPWTSNIALTRSVMGNASSSFISNKWAVEFTPHCRTWGSSNNRSARRSVPFLSRRIVYLRASEMFCLTRNKVASSSKQLRSERDETIKFHMKQRVGVSVLWKQASWCLCTWPSLSASRTSYTSPNHQTKSFLPPQTKYLFMKQRALWCHDNSYPEWSKIVCVWVGNYFSQVVSHFCNVCSKAKPQWSEAVAPSFLPAFSKISARRHTNSSLVTDRFIICFVSIIILSAIGAIPAVVYIFLNRNRSGSVHNVRRCMQINRRETSGPSVQRPRVIFDLLVTNQIRSKTQVLASNVLWSPQQPPNKNFHPAAIQQVNFVPDCQGWVTCRFQNNQN